MARRRNTTRYLPRATSLLVMPITGRSEFSAALNQVANERGLDPIEVLDTIKAAILAAYRRDYNLEEGEEVDVSLDPESGEVKLLKEGKDVTPAGFGRIAAQTAKQVLLQRIREAEKDAILLDFSQKVGLVVSGMIQRQQGPAFIVDIGRAEAVLPPREQSRNEEYRLNQRLKFYIVEIRERDKRSEIIVSRAHPELVTGLFKQEVPEINAGSVEIKAVAREAGFRTKIAVTSNQMGVDPVGSCVGQKGNRIQTVINELNGEKIDVIPYNEDTAKFITQALQPAKDVRVVLDARKAPEPGEEPREADANAKTALVIVPEAELSLAIGKQGQNVRLAAKLTGYHIDILSSEQYEAQKAGNPFETPLKSTTEAAVIGEEKKLADLRDLEQPKKKTKKGKKEAVAKEAPQEIKAEETEEPLAAADAQEDTAADTKEA